MSSERRNETLIGAGMRRLMAGSPVGVRLVKAIHPDVEYDAVVVSDDGTHVVVRGPWAEQEARDLGFVRFEPGDIFTEHYWRDRWYSIKEVRAGSGDLKGWYCDVARPVRIEDRQVISEDLDLDLWVSADGRTVLRLDEDEFAAGDLAQTDPAAATRAQEALTELERLASDGFRYLMSADSDASRPTVSQYIFPDASIETPRLLLRPHRAEDAPDVALACRDELTQHWLPLPNPYTDADALAWCTEMAPRFRTSGEGIEWVAIRRADDRLIGSFGLKRTDWRGRTTEIGYWVAPWGRGEGLAVEAVMAIARWLLLEQGFERLGLRAAPGNVASQRVAEKAGFTHEGVARNAGFTNAGRTDLVVFSPIRSDINQADGDVRPPALPDG